ncbi:MAG: hypothetical protein AB8D52_03035 [Gammaproteobacteria bacterium]
MDGYSIIPLNDPVFDYAKVIVDSTVFNNWLNENYSKLDAQSIEGAKEHLYYLLGSYVSELNKKHGIILPKENDLVLEALLSWAERLDVFGAHLFYNKVKNKKSKAMPASIKVSEGIKISAVNDMYRVESKHGSWSVRFPYYFMIGNINEFNATNGMQTQLLSISTGAVKDKTKAGRSQSTLMFIHSPSQNTEEFKNYWLTQFDISSKIKPKSLGFNKSESFYIYNKQSQLHKEITFLPSSQGSYLVAYLGMDGAFQINKQHFLDFLSKVNLTDKMVPDKQ